MLFAVYLHAPRLALGDHDTSSTGLFRWNFTPELLRQFLHRLDERVHAALREPQAVLGELGVGEERVDRRRPERREPQVHRLEAERLAQLVGLEEAGDGAIVVVHCFCLGEQPQVPEAEEVARFVEVPLDELAPSEAVFVAGVFEESVEVRRNARLYALELVY